MLIRNKLFYICDNKGSIIGILPSLSLKNKTMEANNNNNNHISSCEEVLVTTTIPLQAVEKIDLLEEKAQNKETAIVIPKEDKNKQQLSIKHVFQSLFYAVQWSQLKRQLTKEALLGMAKRHWPKAIAVVAVGGVVHLGIGLTSSASNTGGIYRSHEPTTLSTASLLDTDFGQPVTMTMVSAEAKSNYIQRFSKVAQGEMEKFGIPASVILGLAILHSNYGVSDLAQTGNNHFHITCTDNHLAEGIKGRGMHEGECYIHYQNAWTSFRANSLKLNTEQFEELKKIAGKEYQIWVSGLQKMGLQEADDLLNIIEQHQLDQFDDKN